jgi:hypothetical protein
MRKEFIYYKTTCTEASDLRHYLKERRFNDLETAIEYVEKCWEKFKPEYLREEKRKIIHEYIHTDRILSDYTHQIVTTWDNGYSKILTIRVIKSRNYIYDSIEDIK